MMVDPLIVDGRAPCGGRSTASAAKNAALPELCAALLTARPVVLAENMPELDE